VTLVEKKEKDILLFLEFNCGKEYTKHDLLIVTYKDVCGREGWWVGSGMFAIV